MRKASYFALAATFLFIATNARADEEPLFFSYEGDAGQTVYVNDASMVPDGRIKTAIDLSEISLNTELGNEINERLTIELEELAASDPCLAAKEEAKVGVIQHTVNRHGTWLLAAIGVFVLLLLSPKMSRALPQGTWSRFLMVAIPAIGFVTVLATITTRASETITAVKGLSDLCENSIEGALPKEKAKQLSKMRSNIESLYADRFRVIDEVLKNSGQ